MKRTRLWIRNLLITQIKIIRFERFLSKRFNRNEFRFLMRLYESNFLSRFVNHHMMSIVCRHVHWMNRWAALVYVWVINRFIDKWVVFDWLKRISSLHVKHMVSLFLFWGNITNNFICLFPPFNESLFSFKNLVSLGLNPFLYIPFLLFVGVFSNLPQLEFILNLVQLFFLSSYENRTQTFN